MTDEYLYIILNHSYALNGIIMVDNLVTFTYYYNITLTLQNVLPQYHTKN